MPVVSDYTALLSEYTWHFDQTVTRSPVFVTYTFLETDQLPSLAQYEPFDNDGYITFNAGQRAAFRQVIDRMEAVSGIRFVEVNDPADAQIEVMRTTGSVWAGWASYPFQLGSRIVIDAEGSFAPGTYAFETMLHELGHAVGLEHPFEGENTLPPSLDNENNTLMSYTSNGVADTAYKTLDVQALRYFYGPQSAVPANWSITWVPGLDRIQIIGTSGSDDLFGDASGNNLIGAAGNDTITGSTGDDSLFGGAGIDLLIGGGGTDYISGGAHNDRFLLTDISAFASRLYGDDGDDRFDVAMLGATVSGGAGYDTVFLTEAGTAAFTDNAAGFDTLLMTGVERVVASRFGNTITGSNAETFLQGGARADSFEGGGGDDRLRGLGGSDRLDGGTGADFITGDAGNDFLIGGAGDDLLRGGDDRDVLQGDAGVDRMFGDAGVDLIYGGAGNDLILGGIDADRIFGGAGRDVVRGEAGNDTIAATVDADVLFGGAGADLFRLSPLGGQTHIVMDYQPGIDAIDLFDAGRQFAALTLVDHPNGALILNGAARLYLPGVELGALGQEDFV
ncbi:MAG: hypothetical protein AAFR46_18530 [Pseudomonadota bacterium]